MLRTIGIIAACAAVPLFVFFCEEIIKLIMWSIFVFGGASFVATKMCEYEDAQRARERAEDARRERDRDAKLARERQQRQNREEALKRSAKPQPAPPPLNEEDFRRERLKQERRWYEIQGNATVWNKPDNQIGIKDALEIAGLQDLPAPEVLPKLRDAALAENAETPLRVQKIERAFHLLIAKAG